VSSSKLKGSSKSAAHSPPHSRALLSGAIFFRGSRSETAISEATRFSRRTYRFESKTYFTILEAISFIKILVKYIIRTEIQRAITSCQNNYFLKKSLLYKSSVFRLGAIKGISIFHLDCEIQILATYLEYSNWKFKK